MSAYEAWVQVCDWLLALVTEGMMTDDFPAFDWRAAFAWGDTPERAVIAAVCSA